MSYSTEDFMYNILSKSTVQLEAKGGKADMYL